ncbi:MAG: polysaccharide biosynthesis tyrosine autokinase [Sphaerochaetaceae bacterium]|nr:polysaccharide biosynthesis tyrosine autokinase [Sphaerochaetaceae bacterium]
MSEEKQTVIINETPTGDEEISILYLLQIIKQKLWITILFSIFAVALAGAYLYRTIPTYETSVSVMVNPIQDTSSIEKLLSASSSTNISTEVALLTSNTTLESAKAMLDLSSYYNHEGIPYSEIDTYTIKSLKTKVSVSTSNNTKIVSIKVSDHSPQFCADYANAIAEAYMDLLTTISKNSKTAQRTFLESQIPQTEALLKESSDALAEYREVSGISQLSARNALLTKNLTTLQLQEEPLRLQLIENESLIKSLSETLGLKVETTAVAKDSSVSKLIEDYKSNLKELMLYNNISDESNNRVHVLESSILSKEKDILNAVVNFVSKDSQNLNASYGRAIADYLCTEAQIEVIKTLEKEYDEEISLYPEYERRLLELERDVEIYQAMVLTLKQTLEETKMLEAAVVGNVTVIDAARVPLEIASPSKIKTLAIALIAGMVLGVGVSLLTVFLKKTISDEEDIIRIIGKNIPSLGWTPSVSSHYKLKVRCPSLFVVHDGDSSIAERFKAIANNISYSSSEKLQVLSVNSTDMSEGKTTSLCNIAASYALNGKKVLLVDLDFRRPAMESFFELKRSKKGVVDIVVDDIGLDECIVRPLDDIQNLHLLPSGHSTKNPGAILSSNKFDELINKLRIYYDYILIDSPPISFGSEFNILSKNLDGFILVVRSGVSFKASLSQFVKNLSFISSPLLGYVYSCVPREERSKGRSGYYSSGYHKYYYGSSKKKSIYKEEKHGLFGFSYKKFIKQDSKRRNKAHNGKYEPSMAFSSEDFAKIFVNESREVPKQNLNIFKETEVKKEVKTPEVVEEKDPKVEVDRTLEMLSIIEQDINASGKKKS